MDDEDIQFVFEERARLAENFFRSSDCRIENYHELSVRQVQTIQDWVSLCGLREGLRKRRVSSRTDIGLDGRHVSHLMSGYPVFPLSRR
jgi:hypothetical protein